MIAHVETSIPLDAIAGPSPLNPRADSCEGIDGLVASIRSDGVLQPLLIHRKDGQMLALDGSRRLAALRRLVEAGVWQGDAPVKAIELIGPEAELREAALAANLHRLALHPVEQYEAFAALALAGMSEERIAAAHDITTKDVRKALALGRLAPEILAAWKAGNIEAETAQAFAASSDRALQAKVFAELSRGGAHVYSYTVRNRLRADAMAATSAEAAYARAEYLAAGGRIDESLFEDQSWFLDGALLNEIVIAKLKALGERICAEYGWAWALDADQLGEDMEAAGEADFLAGEDLRLDEIDQQIAICDAATRDALAAERLEIELRAWSRGVDAATRAHAGLTLTLDCSGVVSVEGAWLGEAPAFESDDEDDIAAGDDTGDDDAPAAPRAPAPRVETTSAPAKKENKKLIAQMNATFAAALRDIVAQDVRLAMALVVATLFTSTSISTLRASYLTRRDDLGLIADLPFSIDEAFARLVRAPLRDLTDAFCRTVARTLDPTQAASHVMRGLAEEMSRLAPLRAALHASFDRDAWFADAGKDEALAAIRDCLGEAAATEAAKKSKSKIAAEAAILAKDKHWLPPPWRDWALTQAPRPSEPTTLADAMAQALDADADGKAVERFIAERVTKADGLRVRAGELHEAFLRWCVEDGVASPPAIALFGKIMTRLGAQRHHQKTGAFYVGMALTQPQTEAAQ